MGRLSVKKVDKTIPEAFHGTELAVAQKIVSGEKFQCHRNSDNYLGDGVYFYEGSPHLAEIWAKRRHKEYGVLEAEIRLGRCLDLNTYEHVQILRVVREELKKRSHKPEDITDAFVINYYATHFEKRLDTVRWTLTKVKHGPIYPRSRIFPSQLIICVRNIGNIGRVSLVITGVG